TINLSDLEDFTSYNDNELCNKIPFLPPTASPVIPIRSSSYNSVVRNDFNVKLHKTRQQQKVNSDWAVVYSIFIQFVSLSDHVGSLPFAFEEDEDQEITNLIRISFPIEGIERPNISFDFEDDRNKKMNNLIRMSFQKEEIKAETSQTFLEHIRDLNITINYLQDVEPDLFKKLVNLELSKIKLKISCFIVQEIRINKIKLLFNIGMANFQILLFYVSNCHNSSPDGRIGQASVLTGVKSTFLVAESQIAISPIPIPLFYAQPCLSTDGSKVFLVDTTIITYPSSSVYAFDFKSLQWMTPNIDNFNKSFLGP
ncbi:43320_t:CDS:2, partial [Gigaspora margarita]